MNIKKIIAATLSAALIMCPGTTAALSSTNAETTYTVTFLDFDGKVFFTQSVGAGGNIDYSFIDTSSLHRHVDAYTEQEFCGWSSTPSTVNSNITIQALARTAVISVDGLPTKTRYYTKSGNVATGGLNISITISTQLPEFTVEGEFKTTVTKVNITNTCTIKPSTLAEAFKSSDTAEIKVYPINTSQPICSYTITNYQYLGDVDQNGKTDSVDASAVLTKYAQMAANQDYTLDAEFVRRADVNFDGIVDARDASTILKYYAVVSTNSAATWDNIIDFN